MKTAIITDSCSDLPVDLAQEHGIFVLPLIIRCSDGEYRDGVDITADDVYHRLETELPKTSLPMGNDITELFDKIRQHGYDSAVAIMLSSGLSGTYNAVRMLSLDYEGLDVRVLDSVSGSLGTGAMALQLAQYAKQGMGIDELVQKAQKLIENTHAFFSIDTLEYLKKGGRIGKVTAAAGTLLNIKPVLSFAENGELVSVAKARGRKNVKSTLIEMVKKYYQPGRKFNLLVANGGAPTEGAELKRELAEAFPGYENYFETNIGATLSVYIGPGVLGAGIQFLD